MYRVIHLSALVTLLMISFLISSCRQNSSEAWSLQSPDAKIIISISHKNTAGDTKQLLYRVSRIDGADTISVIEPSLLGLIRGQESFNTNLEFVSQSEIKTIDETYEMKIGRQTKIRNHANEFSLRFKNDKGSLIDFTFRAYNDGVAFNYAFPDTSDSIYTITQELTEFKLPANGKAWLQPYDVPSKWTPAYEKYFENGIAIGSPSPNKEGWAFPALFETAQSWLLISEANLKSNYCGIRLEQNAPEGRYKVRFPEAAEAEGIGQVEPSSALPWLLPWRAIIIGGSLATVFESQLINNLSDPAVEGDFSWVKPGRSSWSWITQSDSPKNFAALKAFVDVSAEMHWEYSLVDANWDLMTGGNIEQLVQYANTKNVGILMWYNSGGTNNTVEERPRDIIFNSELRKKEFKKLQQWGVKGIKIDFWLSDKQNLIAYYLDVLKDAATYRLLVNFHGCTIPRGWSRTYPQLLTMESVMGEECYRFDSTYPVNAPVQNTIIPFTRNVIGPMDYTPFCLSDLKFPHITTFAHELALTLIYNSGIVHFAENEKIIRSLPDFVKNYLRTLPVVFDQTKYLSGRPATDILIAARSGNEWYIAGINGTSNSLEQTADLSFIGGGLYKAAFILDGANGKSFVSKVEVLSSASTIKQTLLPNGGFVCKLTPEQP